MTEQLPLALPVPADAAEWVRYPGICRSNYRLHIGGRPADLWVMECGHPTALRPYYVQLRGRVLARKYARAADAKVAALAAFKESRS